MFAKDKMREKLMLNRTFYLAISALIGACFLASCSVTTAPTDASSGTTGQTTDASSDLTSSTTSDDDDDEEKEDETVEEFVTANFSQLRSNMSVGRGEYLASLADLLAIDTADKEQFYAMTKNNFTQIFVSPETTAKEFLVNLKQEMTQVNI